MPAAKLISIAFTPWRKYNEFFDKGCWGIWGLSPVLKYTLLFLGLFFVPPIIGLVDYANSDTYFSTITIFFLLIALVWIIYFPILSMITLFRALKKVESGVRDLNNKLKEEPWKITPRRLYTQPHWHITVIAFYLKDYLIDFLDWTTQYYPISLLSTSPVRYPISMKVRHLSRLFESRFAELKIPLKYIDFEINQQFTLYKFELYEDVKDFAKVVKKITKGFKYNYGFYIREENEQINVIVPHAQ